LTQPRRHRADHRLRLVALEAASGRHDVLFSTRGDTPLPGRSRYLLLQFEVATTIACRSGPCEAERRALHDF
jgi:hypothetical protein